MRDYPEQERGKRLNRGFGRSRFFPAAAVIAAILLLMQVPACAAEYNHAYPAAITKKGLYVCPGMEEDAVDLGIQHATINLSVNDFMPAEAYRSETYSIPFEYEGTTYWFAKDAVGRYDEELLRLAQNKVLVTAILLLPYRSDDMQYLIYPPALGKSANYYQWNMTDENAVRALRAIVTFFQRRYAGPSGARIVGWIVGNEVNNSGVWNWAGEVGIDTYVDVYAEQVAQVYRAARQVYKYARIYMCLDHYWTAANGSYWYPGKEILTRFAKRMSARGLGNGTWCIAYHPYNISQYEPNIISNSAAVTNKADTRIITMKNLKVLTDYVKKKYTKKCRVILSEQGYSSVTAGRDTSKEQARNIALAYYIAQQNSMVDALILHRQVDHTGEGEKYGLYTSWGLENAAYKKPSWTAYKYADTTKTNSYTTYAAKKAKTLSGKSVKKLSTVSNGKLSPIRNLSWKKTYTGGFKAYGALSGFQYEKGGYTLTHDYARNANVPWGIIRKGKINCKTCSKFGFGIYVNSSVSGSAVVYLRLWSGSKHYFDASATIPCAVPHSLYVDLKKWKKRGKITKVEIYIRPSGSGWTGETAAQIHSIGIRK